MLGDSAMAFCGGGTCLPQKTPFSLGSICSTTRRPISASRSNIESRSPFGTLVYDRKMSGNIKIGTLQVGNYVWRERNHAETGRRELKRSNKIVIGIMFNKCHQERYPTRLPTKMPVNKTTVCDFQNAGAQNMFGEP